MRSSKWQDGPVVATPSGFDSLPMRKLPCFFWTPKRYWVRSSPGKALSGEVDCCLTGPRGMTREAGNP
ncbi:hypothetical protein F2Q69_00029631 [Brassica cretica]|uniref:Uncharacterized protein n=1 Tax=Brassica cretica TaxID=69181 RepID=A0A8S9RYN0_BRACR|nr:hypothetical protein F2Q69_00029631 [Brassica cretica]